MFLRAAVFLEESIVQLESKGKHHHLEHIRGMSFVVGTQFGVG